LSAYLIILLPACCTFWALRLLLKDVNIAVAF
jgi:hypothetical protein